jgi:carbamoyl-phosphate synthase large subunit
MPKRTDIKKILLIGSGPIVIGQACEFDYSGAQACKALREEGYSVVLVNSNPATIMTDPGMADATYIEPLSVEMLELIIKKERPDALLPTMGGQTALNLTVELCEAGVVEKYGVKLIGANLAAIKKAEDRDLFKNAMKNIGLEVPKSATVTSIQAGIDVVEDIGFPAILRPAFTLGGTGGATAYNIEEFRDLLGKAIKLSPVHQVLVEESALGWKEYELEVMRDVMDNVVIICSIENLDPMGVHTGDSITVAPAQTLTDKEYQRMRDASIAVIREIGVDTGGSNIQFALNPQNGRMVVIEMNPRVSRSSALASKATGFPIAKIAAKLAVGYTLDEIRNDITRVTPASFEPSIDYVVTKVPRFTFEKFPEADPTLTIQMKSVGEVMAIGRTFKESIQKALRSLETGTSGFDSVGKGADLIELRAKLKTAHPGRIWYVAQALREGMTVEEISDLTYIDRWFLNNIRQIVEMEKAIRDSFPLALTGSAKMEQLSSLLREAKEYGFSDKMISELTGGSESDIRNLRRKLGLKPVYKLVDTCAAEFEAFTPYLYSSYERPYYRVSNSVDGNLEDRRQGVSGAADIALPGYYATTDCDSNPTSRKKVIILGSGPNRIGQGIEFDYCCVQAVFGLRDLGYETIMINCNPETVSTDYDTADRLYFEPLTIEDVMNIIELEKPEGVIVQFGGQTPLKLAVPLEKEGVAILGTSPDSIDRAEDRKRFRELLQKLGLRQPESDTVTNVAEAVAAARIIGYPVMVRPSYVLGGRAMEIVYDEVSLMDYMERTVKSMPEHPILVDKYLEDAIEVDVDAISDGADVVIGGVMEHIEEAGIHSGDSACSIPPYSLSDEIVENIKTQARALAMELQVRGLMNVQFAVKDGDVYILEVNPRASRTIPYVSKATGVSLARLAAQTMAGKTLRELGLTTEISINHVAVKEAVFPFDRFPAVDTILGPEMKSTGEVMGIDDEFGLAYAKSQAAANNRIPVSGRIFLSVKDKDKPLSVDIARKLIVLGFSLVATRGTAGFLSEHGIAVDTVNKVNEGRPHIIDMIKNEGVQFIINTVADAKSQRDSFSIRRSSLQYKIPYTTTISSAKAVVMAIESLLKRELGVKSIQEYHKAIGK